MSLQTRISALATAIGTDIKTLMDLTGNGPVIETNPVFTYDSLTGNVTNITYISGNYKTFTYSSGIVSTIDYVVGTITYRKTFTYNPDGSLANIVQTQF